MRRVAIVAGLTLLAACGQKAGGGASANLSQAFSGGFRTSYRAKFIDSCTIGAKQAAIKSGNAAGAGLDYLPLCSCAADRLLATKSITELMTGPSEADQRAVPEQCIREHPPV